MASNGADIRTSTPLYTGRMRPLGVLVVDDDDVSRTAYAALLRRTPGFTVVGEAVNGSDGVMVHAQTHPDVTLMDLNMPVMSGTEAITAIRRTDPMAFVVVLTTFDAHRSVITALRAGAAGYLLKDTPPADVIAGLRDAADGGMPLSARVRQALVASVVSDGTTAHPASAVSLTPRQHELVGWLGRGMSNVEIGRQMHLSEGSVKQYLSQIGTRLDATNRTQILVRAVQLGFVDPHTL